MKIWGSFVDLVIGKRPAEKFARQHDKFDKIAKKGFSIPEKCSIIEETPSWAIQAERNFKT